MNNYKFKINIFNTETEEQILDSTFLVLSINSKRKTFTIVTSEDFLKLMQENVEYSAKLILGDSEQNIVITSMSYHANGDLLISYENQGVNNE